jgi:hypothetical protein
MEERVGVAVLSRAPRTADAVAVLVNVLRGLKVDNRCNVRDVKSARSHVCRNEHAAIVFLELVHDKIPIALSHPPVQDVDETRGQ